MALHDYLAGEVGEDWADGMISRREALRRLALLGLSVGSAIALLEACAPADGPATAGPTSGSAGPSVGAPTSASPGTAASASPGPPADGEAITFPGPTVELQGFFVAAGAPRGAMLVIHENRGLTDHIRSVASRLAADGYSALAIDLLSEEGGTAALGPGRRPGGPRHERRRSASSATCGPASTNSSGAPPGAKLGAIGFCFGGGMVWALLDAGEPRLAAAVPFYGPRPRRRTSAATPRLSSASTPSRTLA